MSAGRAAVVTSLLAAAVGGVLLAATLEARGAVAPAAPPPAEKVLVVSVPRLVWQDVADQRPPALLAFLAESAYASTSVRTIGPRTELGDGYVTIGAGNAAKVDPAVAGRAVTATESVGSASGADLYRKTTGQAP
ncbi:MAG TPA: hypothetical protein VGF22_14110, partial [Acidimicrobiales bacterium]